MSITVRIIDWIILFLLCIYSRLNLIVELAITRRGTHYDK